MKERHNVILDLDNRQEKIQITDEMKKLIEDCLVGTLEWCNFPLGASISIILVDNPTIAKINSEFRHVKGHTDVLSFPIIDIQPGEMGMDDLSNDMDLENGGVILGDIIISMEQAVEQALDYGHSLQREIGFLLVHGMLHLLGYDHITDRDRNMMRTKEKAILNDLKLTRE